MYTLKQYSDPLVSFWTYLTSDPSFCDTQTGGTTTAGNDYISRSVYAAHKNENNVVERMISKFHQRPQIQDFLEDNILLLSVCAGLDRVISFRQGYWVNRERLMIGNSSMGGLQAICQDGMRKGYLRGYWLYLMQQVGIRFHASQLSGDNWTNYLAYSSLMEVLLYPIDTLKTISHNDVFNRYKSNRSILASIKPNHLYQGISFKLLHNLFYTFNLKQMYDQSNLMYLSLPLWIASYGLLSLKTVFQLNGTYLMKERGNNSVQLLYSLSRNNLTNLYSGLSVYLIVNTAVMLQLPILRSQEYKQNELQKKHEDINKMFNGNKYKTRWE